MLGGIYLLRSQQQKEVFVKSIPVAALNTLFALKIQNYLFVSREKAMFLFSERDSYGG